MRGKEECNLATLENFVPAHLKKSLLAQVQPLSSLVSSDLSRRLDLSTFWTTGEDALASIHRTVCKQCITWKVVQRQAPVFLGVDAW